MENICWKWRRETKKPSSNGEGNRMSNRVRMALLIVLCVYCYLFIHSPSGSAETLGPPELHMPGAKFGGMYRRVLRQQSRHA